LFKQLKEKLLSALDSPRNDLSALIEESQVQLKQHNEALHKGRDRLLEYNSCRPHLASKICNQV